MIFIWLGSKIDSFLKPRRGRDPPAVREQREREIKRLRQARQKRLEREKEDKEDRP